MTEDQPTIYTIGHSNQPADVLLALLKQHAIEVLADVRSAPYSRYAPHFSQGPLRESVRAAGVRYVYLGRELGGRPDDESLHDARGYVDYARIAATAEFQAGLARLVEGIGRYRVALMCGEEDPTDCHRRLLVGRVLARDGVRVLHIRGDGRVQAEEELEPAAYQQPFQPSLFGDESTEGAWTSTRPVLPRNPNVSARPKP
jgi:uncharacterized protein (DUF488 family)